MADARAGLTPPSRKGAAKRNFGRDRTNRCDWAFASPPCAVLNRVRAVVLNLCVAENIRKNWVYTPADWKSQLVIRRKSLYHGITRPSRKAPAFSPGISGLRQSRVISTGS